MRSSTSKARFMRSRTKRKYTNRYIKSKCNKKNMIKSIRKRYSKNGG